MADRIGPHSPQDISREKKTRKNQVVWEFEIFQFSFLNKKERKKEKRMWRRRPTSRSRSLRSGRRVRNIAVAQATTAIAKRTEEPLQPFPHSKDEKEIGVLRFSAIMTAEFGDSDGVWWWIEWRQRLNCSKSNLPLIRCLKRLAKLRLRSFVVAACYWKNPFVYCFGAVGLWV